MQPNLLTQSLEVVEGARCSPNEGNSWWENPFFTSPPTTASSSSEYLLTYPSSNFTGISSIQSMTQSAQSSIYNSTYPWTEEHYIPYTAACSGVEVTSQSYAAPQVSMSEQSYNLSPQAVYSSPPPYPYSQFSSSVPASVQNNFYPSSGIPSPVESPVSSPESLDIFMTDKPKLTALPRVNQICLPPISDLPGFSTFANYSTTNKPLQMDANKLGRKQVRMPQRKLNIFVNQSIINNNNG